MSLKDTVKNLNKTLAFNSQEFLDILQVAHQIVFEQHEYQPEMVGFARMILKLDPATPKDMIIQDLETRFALIVQAYDPMSGERNAVYLFPIETAEEAQQAYLEMYTSPQDTFDIRDLITKKFKPTLEIIAELSRNYDIHWINKNEKNEWKIVVTNDINFDALQKIKDL